MVVIVSLASWFMWSKVLRKVILKIPTVRTCRDMLAIRVELDTIQDTDGIRLKTDDTLFNADVRQRLAWVEGDEEDGAYISTDGY